MAVVGSSTRIRQTRERLEDLPIIFPSEASQAFFITAPSMTTPNVTYFHSATSSLRARATMVVFFRVRRCDPRS